MERFDLVQRAYDELVASGDIVDIPPGTNHDRLIEEQKAYLTRRAAYYLNLEYDSSIGLLLKTTGNNVMGLSVDIVTRKANGDFWDIASNDANHAIAIDGGRQQDATFPSRWVQPTKELAGLPSNGNGGNGNGDINTNLVLIINQNNYIIEQNNQQIQLLHQIVDNPIEPKFPITYPKYIGKLFGITIALNPDPTKNP